MLSRILAMAAVSMFPLSLGAADKAVELLVLVPKEPVELDLAAAKKAIANSTKPEGLGDFQTKMPITLRIINRTDAAIGFQFGSDASFYTLSVTGPGVKAVFNPLAQTTELRPGKPVTVAPGKTFDIELTGLEYGSRGRGDLLIIMEPGEYVLTATYQMATEEGRGALLKSAPAKFTIVEKN